VADRDRFAGIVERANTGGIAASYCCSHSNMSASRRTATGFLEGGGTESAAYLSAVEYRNSRSEKHITQRHQVVRIGGQSAWTCGYICLLRGRDPASVPVLHPALAPRQDSGVAGIKHSLSATPPFTGPQFRYHI
jgi:hypothetical protein